MILRIIPVQIPVFWDRIKYALSRTDTVVAVHEPEYFNKVLHSLLAGKSQCFLRINEKRIMTALAITKILGDKLTGEKTFHIQSVYAFESTSDEEWKSNIETLRKFAENMGCRNLTCISSNKRIFELVSSMGFIENHRVFIRSVEA